MTAAGDKTGEYSVVSDARNSLFEMHALLLNYLRDIFTLSAFSASFADFFFK